MNSRRLAARDRRRGVPGHKSGWTGTRSRWQAVDFQSVWLALADRTVSFRAAIEGDGPAGDGTVVLGCLTSGLTYNISIDAIGDAGGALAVKQITRRRGRVRAPRQVFAPGLNGPLGMLSGSRSRPPPVRGNGPVSP